MCGIWAVFGSDAKISVQCKAAHVISHRGPDSFRIENTSQLPNCCLGFHRLAIVDSVKGMQPLRLYTHPNIWLTYNGEIYNHAQLSLSYELERSTEMDGEPMIHLYQRLGAIEMAKLLDGTFAFTILDMANRRVILGRDTYGVRPMFRFLTKDGFLAVCSEAKGLYGLSHGQKDGEIDMTPFPPGHVEIYDLDYEGKVTLKERACFNKSGQFPLYKTQVSYLDQDPKINISNLLEAAVEKRLMAERKIGCLLSGGVDSSLVAALVVKLAKKRQLSYKVQTFCVGMPGSPDLVAARKVADYLGTEHHEVIVSAEDCVAAIPDVIYHLESYDITSVRPSLGMFLLSKYIKKNTDTTVILSGEGADELAQGYIYFHNAPSPQEADVESRRLLGDLHLYDVLRGDRCTSAWGLEIRLPFLDHQFTSYYLSLDDKLRQPKDGIEKHLLRSSFMGSRLLPDETLWRPKEEFSDGMSSINKKSLYEFIHDHASQHITDEMLRGADAVYPHNPPKSKEAMYYRQVFEQHYPGRGSWIPYMWLPKWSESEDPSARTLTHNKQ